MATAGIAADRERVVDFVEAELIGPRSGAAEIVSEDRPEAFYSAGILFPVASGRSFSSTVTRNLGSDDDKLGASQHEEAVPGGVGDSDLEMDSEGFDDPVLLAAEYKPSAMGISFRIKGPDFGLHITVSGAIYVEVTPEQGDPKDKSASKKKYERQRWQRVAYHKQETMAAGSGSHFSQNLRLDDAPVQLQAVWRVRGEFATVSLSIMNTEICLPGEWPRTEQCFFQSKLEVAPIHPDSIFTRYHDVATLSPDPEERELELLYRKHASFGVGHGCSLAWDVPAGTYVTRKLSTAILPRYSVKPLDYSLPAKDAEKLELQHVLSTEFLANGKADDVLNAMDAFSDAYASWVDNQLSSTENQDIPEYLYPERDRLLSRSQAAARRIKEGVQVLRDNPTALESFRLTNRAMAMQSRHGRSDLGGTPRQHILPDFPAPDYWTEAPLQWRPFQLAFLLLNLDPIINPESPNRNVVDLIWFPTGGGKTEAYLGVSAFAIFYRRLTYREAGTGTVVLMRYSLRLLTSQQFERACGLICACEVIRNKDVERLGHESVSIGLWVGSDGTPNTYAGAVQKMQESGLENPFPIRQCPWCGMQIQPGPADDPASAGIDATPNNFRLFCRQPGCPFTIRLPINFIDQYLYTNPPTILISVVDKFAQLPWNSAAGAFFALPADQNKRPPELIIQDELHLMSGPLGTIVGLYETVVDELCLHHGVRAKIIASTATIRRAREQVKSLYARDLLQFPPAGLHADDSYFARTASGQGRLYLGALLPGITSTTAAVRAFSVLLQAPKSLDLEGIAKDTYWTLVAYFNSLRELGKAETLAGDDIPSRMKVIASQPRHITPMAIENMTSQSTTNVQESLEKLKRPCTDRSAISLLLSSSMLSVGVDVGRLGLMVINGQPKSTSEYIQASSRVGREAGRPGLVVALYSPSKPRDRSHYERFQSYHSAFYRYVEPTSVTPFAPPARRRALLAVLVSLARHLLPGLADDTQASAMTQEAGQKIVEIILNRIKYVDEQELEASRAELEKALAQWVVWAQMKSPELHYASRTAQFRDLLRNVTDPGSAWPMLTSMRNVDVECLLRVLN